MPHKALTSLPATCSKALTTQRAITTTATASQQAARRKAEPSNEQLHAHQHNIYSLPPSSRRIKNAIVMMNMGGPEKPSDTEFFLTNLFTDAEIIPLGRWQNAIGTFVAKRRTPKITEQYEQIGGSPIRRWTDVQGQQMIQKLNSIVSDDLKDSFKHYIAFRYARPLSEDALDEMQADGIENAIAFSQYPQFSCTTTGSSLNHLWRVLKQRNMEQTFKWSVIDRWYTNPTFIDAVIARIEIGLQNFINKAALKSDKDLVLLFSAHSLPVKVITRGDSYAHEVNSTVQLVMQRLNYRFRHLLSWQSKVGFLPWLTPSTADTIEGLGKQGYKHVLVVPIAFTSDHVETLFEIDIEYKELAHECGIEHFYRAPGLNDEALLSQAQAEIVADHVQKQQAAYTPYYAMNCIQCVNPMCRSMVNPVKPYSNLRTLHKQEGKELGISAEAQAEKQSIERSQTGFGTDAGTAEGLAGAAQATAAGSYKKANEQ